VRSFSLFWSLDLLLQQLLNHFSPVVLVLHSDDLLGPLLVGFNLKRIVLVDVGCRTLTNRDWCVTLSFLILLYSFFWFFILFKDVGRCCYWGDDLLLDMNGLIFGFLKLLLSHVNVLLTWLNIFKKFSFLVSKVCALIAKWIDSYVPLSPEYLLGDIKIEFVLGCDIIQFG
jgi:hypothetical protein